MRKETITLREKWIQKEWEKHKGELTMKDLGEIFGVSTGNIYRIINKGRQEKLINK